jgi:hypothetical protein
MLRKLLNLFGWDIDETVRHAKMQVVNLICDITDRITHEARGLAVQIGLAAMAAIFALVSFVILLIGIYRWVETSYNPYGALAAVGGSCAGLALIFIFFATRSRKSRLPEQEDKISTRPIAPAPPLGAAPFVPTEPSVPFMSSTASRLDFHGSLSTLLAQLFTTTPRSGTPLDPVLTQVTGRAAAVSGETISLAADLVRRGSRQAMFGVLGASLLAGWFLSRRTDRQL